MPTPRSDLLLRHLYHVAGPQRGLSDRELVEQFALRRDDATFAELVQRHGAMVHRTALGIAGRRVEAGRGAGSHPACSATCNRPCRRHAGPRGSAVYLWDVMNGEEVVPPLAHDYEVYALAFSPDGKQLLTVSGGVQLARGPGPCRGDMRLWDVYSGKQVGKAWENTEPLEQLAWRPDGKEVLALVRGKAVTWDTATGKQSHILETPAPESIHAAVWSHDGQWVLTADGAVQKGSLRIWETSTGKELCDPVAHPHIVNCLAAAADGRTVVTGSWDGKARLWQVECIK